LFHETVDEASETETVTPDNNGSMILSKVDFVGQQSKFVTEEGGRIVKVLKVSLFAL